MPLIAPAIGEGRGLTSYVTRCELESGLRARFKIQTDSEYRARLQRDPAVFDAAVKESITFLPYWPVSPCPDASSMIAR